MMRRISIALMAIVFLASCAGKYGVMKRRYNKGYYIAHSSKINNPVQTKEQKEVKAEKLAVKNSPVFETTTDNAGLRNTVISAVAISKTIRPENNNSKKDLSITATAEQKNLNTYQLKSISPLLTEQNKIKSKPSKSDDGAMKILLVILCLFPILALVAIYLHDGDITLNFWIDLLLHFILLYWLFGILVVLDVIDLR